jgi:carbon-monoxide dehydrogenase large subunit
VPEDKVRVVARDIGGNFGSKNPFYPEFALVAWAAKRLGRPVKWNCERQESFLGDCQGRDLVVDAELALDADGTFLALRGSALGNVGAHSVSYTPLAKGVQQMSGVYRIPVASFNARAVFSNTPPTNPYRSAGRPEAIFVIERLIDKAARALGVDRAELRRRNLVPPGAMPYSNPLGMTYDSGDYPRVMETGLALSEWAGYAERREASRRKGRLRGAGIANYVEVTSGTPFERALVTVKPEGEVDVVIGTLSSGQGHETSFAQLVTEWLGVPFDKVRLLQGDTDVATVGGGSHSGRSMRLAGIVIGNATRDIKDKGSRIAAHLLEASPEDIEFRVDDSGDESRVAGAGGRFVVKGTDRSAGLFEVAAAALEPGRVPAELGGALCAESVVKITQAGFPYGCAVCEVEIDPETGVVTLERYAAVDDVGRAINPMILHGQTHGGIAQGVGQALLEHCHYDPATGQLLSATLMDYALPRADTLPSFDTALSEVPSATNALGVRAGGEGGTTPALAVVINAIVDALGEFGVDHMEMPATPERVWRAINGTKSGTKNGR